MSGPLLRDAVPADADAIAEIYNDAVLNTTAIWNDATVDAANRVDWLAARRAAGFPVVVAQIDGRVVAYASYGPFRPFDGYRFTVENSVYVASDARRAGIAGALMEELIRRAGEAGLHAMVAAIEAGNEASLRLHARLGFVETGRMPQVGSKFGRWLDLVFLQRTLDARPAPPPSA